MRLDSLSVFLKRKMEDYEPLKVEIAMLTSEIEAENGKSHPKNDLRSFPVSFCPVVEQRGKQLYDFSK